MIEVADGEGGRRPTVHRRRPTYAEAIVSPVPNDECISKNIIQPKVEKSSKKRQKLADHLYNKTRQISA